MDVQMFEKALARTEKVVENIEPQQLSDPTPCQDWDVRALLNHLIGGCAVFAASASDKDLEVTESTDFVGDDHVASFKEAAADAVRGFKTPGVMEQTLKMPWGDTPATVALGLGIADVAVHGWDLAKATRQPAEIDEDVAQAVYGMTTSMMQPLGDFPRSGSFDEPIPVPDDAPIADKALAYLGRQP